MAQASNQRQRTLLLSIERALNHAKMGDYVVFFECDEFIPLARLIAGLVAQTCIISVINLEK